MINLAAAPQESVSNNMMVILIVTGCVLFIGICVVFIIVFKKKINHNQSPNETNFHNDKAKAGDIYQP